ncbi:MAG: TolC family protein [Bacteroidia bacterium]|nr:TolC family protein [Bacteroidia bacterium]
MLKNYTHIFLVVCFAICSIGNSVFAQKTYSLEDCINIALQNNIQTKQQNLQTENAKIDALQSKLSALPTINGQASNNWQTGFNINPKTNTPEDLAFRTNSFGASSSMPVFNGFQTVNNVRLKESDYVASKHDLENSKNNLKLNVANNYLRVLQQNEILDAARNQVSTSKIQLERQQKLYDLGGLNKSKLLQLKAQIATEELNFITQQNLLNSAYLDLWQLIDLVPDTANKLVKLDVNKVLVEDENRTPLAIYTDFEKQSPDVLAAKQRQRSADLQRYVALGARSPRLIFTGSLSSFYTTLGTTYGGYQTIVNPQIGYYLSGTSQVPVYSLGQQTFPTTNESTPFSDQINKNFGTSLGFTLSVPIFNGWNVNSNIQKSTIQMEVAKLTEKQRQKNLFKSINSSYLNFKNAQLRHDAALQSVEANKEAVDISEKQYELGGLSLTDYLASKNSYIKAQTDYLQAKYELVFRKKVLDFYSGKPLN